MVELKKDGVYLVSGVPVGNGGGLPEPDEAREGTMARRTLLAHSRGDKNSLSIKFDALVSHDITYVGIIQTARACNLESFPVPYAMTNCHNSLCAVGGTINEDDHVFGLSAAKKYGGIYVPANQSVIHMYARETLARCGNMILGSDSHTRYGALGTMGIGEGGPELVKQLLKKTYDMPMPEVVLVYLTGALRQGVGPHDVALSLVSAVFKNGFVKNKIMEFVGPGVSSLSVDYRNAIDVMTTETSCLSSIWETDEKVHEYYTIHGRPDAYKRLVPNTITYYDSMIKIDLSSVEPMIALPFHPSNAFEISELNKNAGDIIPAIEKEARDTFGKDINLNLMGKYYDGRIHADQGIIAGCAGGLYENVCEAEAILGGDSIGNGEFSLNVYPGSVPVYLELCKKGVVTSLIQSGAILKPAFCGPCFGAGDTPANATLSIRHTTRNFYNREGSKPKDGQICSVALMDARSIAATAKNKGALTAATECDYEMPTCEYSFDDSAYKNRVYNGFNAPDASQALKFGPNITSWPIIPPLSDNLLVSLAAVIFDEVTTTDELIPSGETSSYRSNPLKLAEFALSRRVPEYVPRCKAISALTDAQKRELFTRCNLDPNEYMENTAIGTAVFAMRPGDGSAREQAASCQRVLGTLANLCLEYATKRYRSNCINWGILPFTLDSAKDFKGEAGDTILIENIRNAVMSGEQAIPATLFTKSGAVAITLSLGALSNDERAIILSGCLMNHYKNN